MRVSEQIFLAAIFYFGQIFVFCWLINKNMLEWFLLIMCKGYTLERFTNVLSRNHPTLHFLLRSAHDQYLTLWLEVHVFFYKHYDCKHIKAQVWWFSKHMLSITLSLAKYYYVKHFSEKHEFFHTDYDFFC